MMPAARAGSLHVCGYTGLWLLPSFEGTGYSCIWTAGIFGNDNDNDFSTTRTMRTALAAGRRLTASRAPSHAPVATTAFRTGVRSPVATQVRRPDASLACQKSYSYATRASTT